MMEEFHTYKKWTYKVYLYTFEHGYPHPMNQCIMPLYSEEEVEVVEEKK